MDKIKRFLKKRPTLGGGITFASLSLIGNIILILFMDMAHVYDIVHVFPVMFIYGPIVNMIGYVPSQFIFIPLALIIDFIIGMLFGLVLKKFIKKEDSYLITLVIMFLLYWFGITYQWLPII